MSSLKGNLLILMLIPLFLWGCSEDKSYIQLPASLSPSNASCSLGLALDSAGISSSGRISGTCANISNSTGNTVSGDSSNFQLGNVSNRTSIGAITDIGSFNDSINSKTDSKINGNISKLQSNFTGNPTFTGNQTLLNGVQFLTNYSSRPDCDSSMRGKVWFSFGGLGVKDTIDVCEKSALEVYTWIGIG